MPIRNKCLNELEESGVHFPQTSNTKEDTNRGEGAQGNIF
jgi:hypothetical protein